MINLKELHTDDLSMNSGKLFREQMIENFKAIQQEFDDLRGEIDSEEQDRKSEDNKLNGRIDKLNDSVNELKDLVKELDSNVNDHEQRLKKIEKLLFGFERVTVTDPSDDIKASQQAVEISNTNGTDDDSVSVVTID